MSPPEPPLRRDDDAPPFAEPWQAQAFAMTVQLHAAGHFSWREWADTLAEVVREAAARDPKEDGGAYYRHWLTALERLVVRKQLTDGATLDARRQAWSHAYATTPHGEPVSLDPATGPQNNNHQHSGDDR